MHLSLKLKIIIIFVVLSLIVSLVSLSFIYNQTMTNQIEDLKESLLMTAMLGARLIDGDAHSQIKLSRSSVSTFQYQKVKESLLNIRAANPKVRYVYTITNDEEGRFFFVVDSADIEDLFSYPGDRYESLSEEDVRAAFDAPQVSDKLITDNWGAYMSGYAPFRNKKGEIVGVLGLDMAGDTIAATLSGIKQNVFAIFLLCVVLSVVFGVAFSVKLMRPINRLLEGTKKIASGELDYHVEAARKDELGALAESFNSMSQALRESDRKLRTSFFDTIRALTVALEAKDPYTRGHSERVMEYGAAIASELGFPDDEVEILKYLYVMHDIGKIGIEENILNKAGELSEHERASICEHSEIGAEILAPISFLNSQLTKIVRSHHEYQDGSGYPEPS